MKEPPRGTNQPRAQLAMKLYLRTLLLVAFSALSVPACRARDAASEWKHLPDSVRAQLHFKATDVPPYPLADSTLFDVHRWHRFREIEGVTGTLVYTGSWNDIVDEPHDRLIDIPPGYNYGAHYVVSVGPDRTIPYLGPAYYWRSDSTLYERGYTTATGYQEWDYFPAKGLRLSHYQVLSGGGDRVTIDEYFDYMGDLAGVMAAARELGKPPSRCYWHGEVVESEKFFRLVAELGIPPG